MGLIHAGLLLLLFSFAYSLRSRSRVWRNPEAEWNKMMTLIDEDMGAGSAQAIGRSTVGNGYPVVDKKTFPEYKRVALSKFSVEPFKPSLDGVQSLPAFAKDLLIVPSYLSSGSSGPRVATSPQRKLVEILCHDDRIYTRIVRSIFERPSPYKDLKLGKCVVNQGTKDHYYFLYYLTQDCGFSLVGKPDYVSITNVLTYKPSGPVIWEIPFNVLTECRYPRAFLSYKIGFHPKLQGGTVFKALTPKQAVALTTQDASGAELTGVQTYTLGQPMYFEIKMANGTDLAGQRIYINKCFMTANRSPSSNPKYYIIDNQGCMVLSKEVEQAKFIAGTSSQRFTLTAFTFNDGDPTSSTKELHMHCQVSVTKATPTPSAKACTYDKAAKKWRELYGDDSLCNCCETTCPAAQPRASRKTISGPSWKVDLSDHHKDTEPWMRSTSVHSVGLDMKEDADFTNYWEDYE